MVEVALGRCTTIDTTKLTLIEVETRFQHFDRLSLFQTPDQAKVQQTVKDSRGFTSGKRVGAACAKLLKSGSIRVKETTPAFPRLGLWLYVYACEIMGNCLSVVGRLERGKTRGHGKAGQWHSNVPDFRIWCR